MVMFYEYYDKYNRHGKKSILHNACVNAIGGENLYILQFCTPCFTNILPKNVQALSSLNYGNERGEPATSYR